MKTLDEIYKIYTDLRLWNPIEKTMKSASGKRPPDEAHGPGKEAIRQQQLCLGESRKEGAHGHAALPAEVRTTLIEKITPVMRGTAPNSKIQRNFVKLFRICPVYFQKFAYVLQLLSKNHQF